MRPLRDVPQHVPEWGRQPDYIFAKPHALLVPLATRVVVRSGCPCGYRSRDCCGQQQCQMRSMALSFGSFFVHWKIPLRTTLMAVAHERPRPVLDGSRYRGKNFGFREICAVGLNRCNTAPRAAQQYGAGWNARKSAGERGFESPLRHMPNKIMLWMLFAREAQVHAVARRQSTC